MYVVQLRGLHCLECKMGDFVCFALGIAELAITVFAIAAANLCIAHARDIWRTTNRDDAQYLEWLLTKEK